MADHYADDADYGEEEYDEGSEEEYEPVNLQPGVGRESVLDAATIAEQTERLDGWENQLTAYSQELSEKAWVSWKRSAVGSIMSELQRKVVPEQWKAELDHKEQRVAQLEALHELSAQKEQGLLQRIDQLENGPGCAREIQEKLEKVDSSAAPARQSFLPLQSAPRPSPLSDLSCTVLHPTGRFRALSAAGKGAPTPRPRPNVSHRRDDGDQSSRACSRRSREVEAKEGGGQRPPIR